MSGIPPELDAALTKALLLARQGRLDQTRPFIAQVRAKFDVAVIPGAAIRTMIAEGVMHAYDGNPVDARDRLRRALALCGLARDDDLTAVAHAWTAFVEYGQGLTSAFATSAFKAIRLGADWSTGARTRAASLLGTAYARCAAFESSAAWFALARRAASSQGDRLMTSAIIFNMASTSLSEARVAAICEGDASFLDRGNLLFLKSSENYDSGVGVAVQSYLHLMLQGFAHSALGDYVSAASCLSSFEKQSLPDEWKADALVPSELAWCRLQLDDHHAALADTLRAVDGLGAMSDLGEEAVALHRISSVFDKLHRGADAQTYLRLSDRALRKHRAAQAEFRDVLDAHAVDPVALMAEL